MVNDISGFGSVVTLIASTTFPTGIQITQFADDTDAFDSNSISIGAAAMGLNGDAIFWSKAVLLPVDMAVVPQSNDDINLGILLENNRVGAGKISTKDIIQLSIAYPNGSTVTFTNGKILDGMGADSIASQGRLKSKQYKFMFENKTTTPAA